MIVLIGASASGKTEIAKTLCTYFHYQKCVTTTTRPKRPNERDGIDYHFITKEAFFRLQAAGAFLEVTEYNDNLYGLQKADALRNGLVIVDPNGANVLIKTMKEDVFVVLVEAKEGIRRKRMLTRGETVAQVEKRIALDRIVFQPKNIRRIDLVIKNNGDVSLLAISELIHERYHESLERHGKMVMTSC